MDLRACTSYNYGNSFFQIIRRENEIYVSPNGSPTGVGTPTDPVDSIENALAWVRASRTSADNNPWYIKLLGGDYSITDTLTLTDADSGTQASPLIIEAATTRSTPRLTGGQDIPFSALENASESIRERTNDTKGAVKQVNLKSFGITDYGTITRRGHLVSENANAQMIVSVDGADMKLAAWPNTGWETITDSDVVQSGVRSTANMVNGGAYRYANDRISGWANPEEIWVSGSLGYNYDYDYYPLSRIDKSQKIVYLREGAIVTKNEYPNKYTNHFFKYENVLEELDTPGEYYIDRSTGMLYIIPPLYSTKNSKITVSCLNQNMVEIQKAHDIEFNGIEFTSGRATGITTTNGGTRIKVKNCKVHGFGKNGVSMSLNTGSSVEGCDVYDIGENAINIRGGNYSTLASGNNKILGNNVYNFAQLERGYKTGIMVGTQSVGTLVSDNYIHDAPHAGIIFYGCNNEFKNNVIERVITEFHDMDAVYANNYEYPWERGNRFHDNYFNDIGNQVLDRKQINITAIRTDNSGHGLNIYHNVFHNIGKGQNNGIAGVRAQGTYNKVWENLFVDCSGTYNSNMTYNPSRTYDVSVEPYKSRKSQLDKYLSVYSRYFPELTRFWDEHPQAVKTNEFKNNVVVNINYEYSTINYTSATLASKNQGYIGAPELVDATGNLVTNQDPGFVDYKNGDYSLKTQSSAYNTVNQSTVFKISCTGYDRAKK